MEKFTKPKENVQDVFEKLVNNRKLQENTRNLNTKRKSYGREKVIKKVATNITESDFNLIMKVANTLWRENLIEQPTMYYFLRYAAKILTNTILNTVHRTSALKKKAVKDSNQRDPSESR